MTFKKPAIFDGECSDEEEFSKCSTVASKNIEKLNVNQNPEIEKQIKSFFGQLVHVEDNDLSDECVSESAGSVSDGGCFSDFEEDMNKLEITDNKVDNNQEQIIKSAKINHLIRDRFQGTKKYEMEIKNPKKIKSASF